jgi:undecaprenyl-diphosphatase
LALAILLLGTGFLQLSSRRISQRKEKDLKHSDSILLGFVQGLASLPGLSRSGTTISTLLLRKFDDTTALRLSFLMSLPIILIGNIFLNLPDFSFTSTAIYGLLTSFLFGYLTIFLLMKLSKRINLAYFVIIFAIIMGISVLV